MGSEMAWEARGTETSSTRAAGAGADPSQMHVVLSLSGPLPATWQRVLHSRDTTGRVQPSGLLGQDTTPPVLPPEDAKRPPTNPSA